MLLKDPQQVGHSHISQLSEDTHHSCQIEVNESLLGDTSHIPELAE